MCKQSDSLLSGSLGKVDCGAQRQQAMADQQQAEEVGVDWGRQQEEVD